MQIKHTQTMQMQGTMTGEEKKMNRRDLKSFKEQDNNIQAMVIGINSTPEPKRNQTKLKIKTADNQSCCPTDENREVSHSLIAHPLRSSIFNKQNNPPIRLANGFMEAKTK